MTQEQEAWEVAVRKAQFRVGMENKAGGKGLPDEVIPVHPRAILAVDQELTQLRERAIPESWDIKGHYQEVWGAIVEDCVKQTADIGDNYTPSFHIVNAILNINADLLQTEAELKLSLELNGTVNDKYIQLAKQREAERKAIAEAVKVLGRDHDLSLAWFADIILAGEYAKGGE